jgi:XTP/dITP diphosphohydrolase
MALALSDEAAVAAGRCAKHLFLTSNAAACEGRRIEALITEGIVEGRITASMRGTGGFGYDPLFEIPHLGRTFAEMAVEAKNRLSHRYRALVEMRELLIRLSFARER